MRIISGRFKSLNFISPRGHRTHPMGDKVKSAIFNTLGDLDGLTVYDAFGGSGALAFEAVSRGAESAVINENDKRAYQAIIDNIDKLGLDQYCQAIFINASSWAKQHPNSYDIVFADPPYYEINPNQIKAIAGTVKKGGLFILSYPPGFKAKLGPEWHCLSHKRYAMANVAYYRRKV